MAQSLRREQIEAVKARYLLGLSDSVEALARPFIVYSTEGPGFVGMLTNRPRADNGNAAEQVNWFSFLGHEGILNQADRIWPRGELVSWEEWAE